ncbi:MAG: DoxX family protein [Kofleriaceae bacterium]|nr:DoxX family protein [Kofleriaceae bacterium]
MGRMAAHPNIAERITETDRFGGAGRSAVVLLSRILLSAIFLASGVAKLLDLSGAAGHLSAQGVSHAKWLVLLAGLAEIAGGLSLVFGFLTRLGAAGLFLFLSVTTYLFHHFWDVGADQRVMQMSQFFKNLAIMGGLGMLVAFGPGRFSLDRKLSVRARHR